MQLYTSAVSIFIFIICAKCGHFATLASQYGVALLGFTSDTGAALHFYPGNTAGLNFTQRTAVIKKGDQRSVGKTPEFRS